MKISGSFKTQDNNTIRVVFYNKKNTATSININTSDDIYFGEEPVIITTEVDDTFAHLLKTQAKITLVTRKWLGDYLFADNVKSIVVNIWKNDVCIFAGYVSANTYNQQYSHELEEIEINCIDTLSTLRNRRLTDDTKYEDLVAQSTIRPFSWFFDQINLEDPAGVIPNLPDFPVEEMHAWFETGWGRNVSDTPVTYQDGQDTVTSYITYYGIESECVILDSETAVATGETRIGEDKTPTYIQSTDTCIVDGIQYYKKYAWITVNGELVNTGDWIIGAATNDMPYVVSTTTRLTGWTTGVLPQPFDFWEHMTTFDVYSNGMEVATTDSLGEQIPEYPNTTTEGSYYEFRQGADDDLDIDETTGTEYFKNYAWVCVNNECSNSGQWVRGNVYSYVVDTRNEVTGWQYDDPAVAFEYYETVAHWNIYNDGHEVYTGTTMGHQIPLYPSSTTNGSFYEMIQADIDDLDIDTVTGYEYYKNYAWVTVNGVSEKTTNWVRGNRAYIVGTRTGVSGWQYDTPPVQFEYYETVSVFNIYDNGSEVIVSSSMGSQIPLHPSTTTDGSYYDMRQGMSSDYTLYNGNRYFKNYAWVTVNGTAEKTNDWVRGNMILTYNTISGLFDLNPQSPYDDAIFPTLSITSNGTTSDANVTKENNNYEYYDLPNDISFMDFTYTIWPHVMSITTMIFNNVDTSSITDMRELFTNFVLLRSLDISCFDTSNVTNMSHMFTGCQKLQTIDLSGFDTSNVTSMLSMFNDCEELQTIDLSSFDTSNVTDMSGMFRLCQNLQTLDLSGFDTSNVTEMGAMFSECQELQTIDLSGFDTSNVTHMWDMFDGCSSLQTIDLSSFDTSNVTGMGEMFHLCSSLQSLDVSNFDTSNVTHMAGMFGGCSSLQSIDVSNFDTSNVEDIRGMFSGCLGLTSIDISSFDLTKAWHIAELFRGCRNLTSINMSGVTLTSRIQQYYDMFTDCDSLATLTLNSVNDFTFNMITNKSVTHLPITVTIYRDGDIYRYNSTSQQWTIVPKISGKAVSTQTTAPTITLNGTTYTADVWDDTTKEFGFTNVPKNVTSIGQMSNIFETLVFSESIDTSSVTSLYNVFHNCESLTALDISHFNTSNVTTMYYMLGVCTSLTSLDLSNFNTSSVTNMMSMFQSCTSLTSLNISNWEVRTNTSTANMFYRTTALTSITMNNVSDTTFNTIGAINNIRLSRITIYRDGDAYKWNSSTQQWEIQS